MGDRANIVLCTKGNADLYLYSHYDGYRIHSIAQDGLRRGKSRWDDPQYLARILFCEMVPQDDWDGMTGYGISTFQGDGRRDVVINTDTQKVTYKDKTYSFDDFITQNFAGDSDDSDD